MQTQYRQGDLVLVHHEHPPSLPLKKRASMVIVAGETTGHAHRLAAGAIQETPDGPPSLEGAAPTQVLHEEHGPLTLDPGWWLVIRQREYTPEAIQAVAD